MTLASSPLDPRYSDSVEPTPDQPKRMPGDPYCGNCGYNLRGATESAKCPECGRPIVEVLTRERLAIGGNARRFRSETMVFGMPFIDVALGPRPDFNEPFGRARGFIAVGDSALGVIAIGGRSVGVVAVGGVAVGGVSTGGASVGVISAMGGAAIGGMATGGAAIGGLASGGGAIGIAAKGGGAVGVYAAGGGAVGRHVVNQRRSDQAAVDAFGRLDWYFGASGPAAGLQSVLTPIAVHLVVAIVLSLALLAVGRLFQRTAPTKL